MKTNDRRTVRYMHSLAFMTCDCGSEMTLAQTIAGDPVYRGSCDCGKQFILFNNQIVRV